MFLSVVTAWAESPSLDQSKAEMNRAYQRVYEESKKAKTLEERRAIRDKILAPAQYDLQMSLSQDSADQLRSYNEKHRSEHKAAREKLLREFAKVDPKHPRDPRAKAPDSVGGPKAASAPERKTASEPSYEEEAPAEALDGSGVKREIEFKKAPRPASK